MKLIGIPLFSTPTLLYPSHGTVEPGICTPSGGLKVKVHIPCTVVATVSELFYYYLIPDQSSVDQPCLE
jgi:hypothetical protein